MQRNLELTHGLIYSGQVCWRWSKRGMARGEAYELVQSAAREGLGGRRRPAVASGADRARHRADCRRRAGHAVRPELPPARDRGRLRPTGADVIAPGHARLFRRGKVREMYDVGDGRLLMVASDRVSAFDVIMDDPIPGKGAVLTALSAVLVRSYRRPGAESPVSDQAEIAARPPRGRHRRPLAAGAPRRAHRHRVRGARLPGRFGLGRVPSRGTVAGEPLPAGLVEVAATGAADLHARPSRPRRGHDENISRAACSVDGRRRRWPSAWRR